MADVNRGSDATSSDLVGRTNDDPRVPRLRFRREYALGFSKKGGEASILRLRIRLLSRGLEQGRDQGLGLPLGSGAIQSRIRRVINQQPERLHQ